MINGLLMVFAIPAPKTDPAKTCTRTPASGRNLNPAPRQISGSDQSCTATRPASIKFVPGWQKPRRTLIATAF
jgi:hypothetical protein